MGYLYALLAAICNSSIGVISCLGFKTLSFYQVAFFKCFLAFILMTILIIAKKDLRKQVTSLYHNKMQISALSFFGVFLLYFFETKAFSMAPVSIVAFVVYSAGILTILLGYLFLNEAISFRKILCLMLVMFGAGMIFNNFSYASLNSLVYAFIGGAGYSVFLVLCRKFRIEANIGFMWWLMGFGTLYLLVPAIIQIESLTFPSSNFLCLISLAVIPTFGGFYFTSKALSSTEAGKVQIIEMSDPLFATLLAFIFLGEVIDLQEMIGGGIILLGLFLIG